MDVCVSIISTQERACDDGRVQHLELIRLTRCGAAVAGRLLCCATGAVSSPPPAHSTSSLFLAVGSPQPWVPGAPSTAPQCLCPGKVSFLDCTQQSQCSPQNESTLLTPLCTPQVHPRCLLPKGHGHHCGCVSTRWGPWLGLGQDGDTAHQGVTVPSVAAGKLCGMAQPCAPLLPSPQHPCLLQEWQCERPHPQADEDLGL